MEKCCERKKVNNSFGLFSIVFDHCFLKFVFAILNFLSSGHKKNMKMFYENSSVFCHLDNEEHFEDLLVFLFCWLPLCKSQAKEFSEPYDDIRYVTFVLIVEARQWFFLLHIVRASFQQFQTSVAPQLSSFSAVTPWYFFLIFFISILCIFACFWLLFYVLIGIVFLFSKHILFTPTYTFMTLLNDIILKNLSKFFYDYRKSFVGINVDNRIE